MSYRNAIRDILPGSLWTEPDFGIVRVIAAAAGCVTWRTTAFGMARPPIGITREGDFRAMFSPLYDRAAIRQQFTMSLANLGEFRVFWLREERRIICRSVSCSRKFRVPDGALQVGVYSAPCTTETLFEDLDELLATTTTEGRHGQARHPAAGDTAPVLA